MSDEDGPDRPHWRELARDGIWWQIIRFRMSANDRKELRHMLELIVPLVTRGHGLQTFEGRQRLGEVAHDGPQWSATVLLQDLDRIDAAERRGGWPEDPEPDASLMDAEAFAISVLKDRGLDYRGLDNTYIVHSNAPGILDANWKQVETGRVADTLRYVFKSADEEFEVNTPVWHALNILIWAEERDFIVQSLLNRGKRSAAFDVVRCTHLGIQIGVSMECIRSKQFDRFTRAGMDQSDGGRKGGSARRGKHSPQTIKTLAVMSELINKHGRSVSLAAGIAHKRGFGTSAAANRRAWDRRKTNQKNLRP